MMFDYRYPSKGILEAVSIKKGYDASSLAGLIHTLMNRRGVKVKSDYEGSRLKGYDVSLYFGDAINIKLSDHGTVTKLIISIINEDKERDIFFAIWQNMTNEGFVSDNVFKMEVKQKEEKQIDKDRELLQKFDIEKHWDYFKDNAGESKEADPKSEIVQRDSSDIATKIKKRNDLVYRWLGRKNELIKLTLPQFISEYGADVFINENEFFSHQKKCLRLIL